MGNVHLIEQALAQSKRRLDRVTLDAKSLTATFSLSDDKRFDVRSMLSEPLAKGRRAAGGWVKMIAQSGADGLPRQPDITDLMVASQAQAVDPDDHAASSRG
jgi:hypothetical protein